MVITAVAHELAAASGPLLARSEARHTAQGAGVGWYQWLWCRRIWVAVRTSHGRAYVAAFFGRAATRL